MPMVLYFTVLKMATPIRIEKPFPVLVQPVRIPVTSMEMDMLMSYLPLIEVGAATFKTVSFIMVQPPEWILLLLK